MAKQLKRRKNVRPAPLRELGKIVSHLWYTPEQYRLVKKAAAIDRLPITLFSIRAVLKAAQNLLDVISGIKEVEERENKRRSAQET